MKKKVKKLKTTTTLYEYLQAEMNKKGHDEYYEGDKVDLVGGELNYMYKISTYDDDIADITNRRIFIGFSLDNPELDKEFKKTFLNRFLYREIGPQTIELFASKVVYTSYSLKTYINFLYENAQALLKGQKDAVSTLISDNRQATATLPQERVNIDVDKTILEYADNNQISRDKNSSDGTNTDFDLSRLNEIFDMYDKIFNTYDRKCFLQIW